MPFIITQYAPGFGVREMQVKGFTPEEMEEIAGMDSGTMKVTVLDLLDKRNSNLGTNWLRGYGVYGMRLHPALPDSVLVTIGTSCD